MTIIDDLKWRYATKQFDASKVISDSDLETLKEAIRLTPTSYGLQPFKVKIITDEKIKNKLKEFSYNQNQITEASHIFIFCNYTKIDKTFIENYIKLMANTRSQNIDELKGYGDFMISQICNLSQADTQIWAAKQSYMGMTNLLTACANLKIDACPIEGFISEKYNEILSINTTDLKSVVVVAVGYRSDDDDSQFLNKVRLPHSDLFL